MSAQTKGVDVLEVVDELITVSDHEGLDDLVLEAREARTTIAELIEALQLAQQMNREALGKFNWGASALDAHAIDLLNRAPAAVDAALARCGGA